MKLSRNKIFFLGLFFAFFLSHTSSASDNKLRVVASITPLADFARQVGGEKVQVALLLPPGASPHTFEPTPRTMQEISQAKIFIRIGAGLEFWADRLIAAAAPAIKTVDCSRGVELLGGHVNGPDREHDSDVAGADPHIWLDPIICIGIIRKIEDAFSGADPSNSSYYKRNAAVYISKLSALDREIAERVKTFRTREYVTFHPAWNYFSKRYGLKVAAVIEESPGKEPSAKHIDKILRLIKKMKTRVVFAEPQFSPKIAEAIAKEAGGRVLFLDPEGTKGRESYIALMHYNLSVMEQAMK
ncbi:MAG: metal ABC transporter substrate-binding protein [Acidobacteriota bacterium]